MTLSELGATLQSEREKRGLTLNDVAERLRISIHVLRALEMGDMNALPHKAYAKGFIRSYATLLGLATDEIEACVASLSGASPSVPQPIAAMDDGEEPTVPAGKMLACALVLLLLAGGGYAVWHFGLPESVLSVEQLKTAIPLLADKGPTSTDTARKQEDKVQSTSSRAKTDGKQPAGKQGTPAQPAPGQAASSKAATATSVAGQPASSQNTGGQNTGAQATTGGQPATNRTASGQAATAQSAPGQAASGQAATKQTESPQAASAQPAQEQPASLPRHHKIIVTATEDCWIQSNADKTNTRQFTLRKGDTFALTFAKSLEVKLGNAAGVRIRYNGNELPPAGKRGETRTLVFPPATQQ